MRGHFASPFAPARKNILETDGTGAPCAWARARGRNQAGKTRAAAKGAQAGAPAHTRYARNRDPPLRPAGSAGANGTERHTREERPCRRQAADGKGTGAGAPWIGQPYARTAHRLCGRRMQIMTSHDIS